MWREALAGRLSGKAKDSATVWLFAVLIIWKRNFLYCIFQGNRACTGRRKEIPIWKKITCGPGEVAIAVHAGCIEAFPCIYVEGDVICSDKGWIAEDYDQEPQPAGRSRYFTRPEQNPTVWEYSEKIYEPVNVTEYNGERSMNLRQS